MCPFLHEDVRGLKEIKKEKKTRRKNMKGQQTPIYNIGNVIVSYRCPNPTKRARDRGYTLN